MVLVVGEGGEGGRLESLEGESLMLPGKQVFTEADLLVDHSEALAKA